MMAMAATPDPKQLHAATPAEFLALVFAYMDLLASRWVALARGWHPYQITVPWTRLREYGATDSLLLWMFYFAHVDHLLPAAGGRRCNSRLEPCKSLIFREASCFALTDLGDRFACEFLEAIFDKSVDDFRIAWDKLKLGKLKPCFNREQRLFTWGEHLLKRFRQPCANQEIILCTGEELHWPDWFDDPLPRRKGHNPKVRLHDTIKDLNRRQLGYLIHFKGDGTGMRVGWEFH
jgi:hypothetical protein